MDPTCDDAALLAALARAVPWQSLAGRRVAVAFSGGLDSTVLLHLASRVSPAHGVALSACHVHHGLSANADAWARHCAEYAARLGVAITVVRVTVARDSGRGVEATARKARYDTLTQVPAEVVLLAHHADDQAETLLLQLLRGAGPRGLAAMPEAVVRGSQQLIRPLLDVPRSALEAYALRHQLRWVEDESNDDVDFDRNFLRHEILPRVAARFPAYRRTMARSALHMATASALADDLARLDLAGLDDGETTAIPLAPLAALPERRRVNALRQVFIARGIELPAVRRLSAFATQLWFARDDAQIELHHAGWVLRRYRGHLHLDRGVPCNWLAPVRWQGEPDLALPPAGGALAFCPAIGDGIALRRATSGHWEVRRRAGGERIAVPPDGQRRTLRNLWQEAGTPPWRRGAAPLLYCDGQLIWAWPLQIAHGFAAGADEPGLRPTWRWRV